MNARRQDHMRCCKTCAANLMLKCVSISENFGLIDFGLNVSKFCGSPVLASSITESTCQDHWMRQGCAFTSCM